MVYEKYNLPIIYPIHPRAEKMIKKFNLTIPKGIKVIKPVGYLDFLNLEKNARLILTDSGGVQEESCILKVPCVTLRDNTERSETIKVGSSVLSGVNPQRILRSTSKMINRKRSWENPFGNGKSAEKIIETLIKNLKN